MYATHRKEGGRDNGVTNEDSENEDSFPSEVGVLLRVGLQMAEFECWGQIHTTLSFKKEPALTY
jgi:hypothetical protein